MAQRSLCSQPARADQHRRARQTAASLPCAAPGEQAAAAWPLCCAWCVVRVPPEAIQRAQPWTSRLTCGCTCTPERRSPDTLPEWSKGWTQVPLARAAWAQIPQVSLSPPLGPRYQALPLHLLPEGCFTYYAALVSKRPPCRTVGDPHVPRGPPSSMFAACAGCQL